MDSILVKIKRIIKEGYVDLRDFGIKVMLSRMYCTLTDETVNGITIKNKAILEYLEKNFIHLLRKYQNNTEREKREVISKDAPIWVFWWQGREKMPEIIEMCLVSKIRNSGNHPVILLTEENIKNYIQFPEYVWNQFYRKQLRIQHLADMIRVQLIKRYGGLWLDASIYCARPLDESIFQMAVYTLKGEEDKKYVSKNQWTTFVIGGQKGNTLCSFLDEFFIQYCKTGKPFIDYFMLDCAINFAYKNIPQVKEDLDLVPKTQGDYYWLNRNLEMPLTEKLLNEYRQEASSFYKIAWNKKLKKESWKYTFFEYLLEKEKKKEEKI